MTVETSNGKRLVQNSLFLYFRMLVVMGIGFFTARKILEALGVVDLGILNVVGSMVAMFDFISSSLTNSTQRFLNVCLGKNNPKLTNQFFSQSLILHVVFALLLVVIIEPVGLYLINFKLVIPSERMDAAFWVFQFSVLSLVIRLVKICFESAVIAREEMSFYAVLSVFEGAAKLIICYLIIFNTKFDNLMYYGALLLALNFFVSLVNVFYCLKKFPETYFRFFTDKKVFKQLTAFIGINSVGVLSWALAKYGIDILMNMFFGPAVNGAKALAAQLDRLVLQFGTNIDLALRPQITKNFAQNENERMISLAMKGSKYIFYVMIVVAMPFLFQTHTLLKIWLGQVPEYSEAFVKIVIFCLLFTSFSSPFNDMSLAMGKIKNVQIYGRLITLSVLPISYFLLNVFSNPLIPLVIETGLAFLYSLFIVYEDNRYLRFGLLNYVRKVLLPIFGILAFLLCLGTVISLLLQFDNVYMAFVLNCLVLWCVSSALCFVIGVEKEDRIQVVRLVRKKMGLKI